MKKDFFVDKKVWITGASSGIGEEPDELERAKKEAGNFKHEIKIIAFDLSDPKEVVATADKVVKDFGGVDFLFNNGGVSTRTMALDTLVEIDRKVMEINYFSGLILTKKLLPGMLERGFGHIIATSSISGKFGFPLRSAYAASKHALHGFYESVWTEYQDKGIRTTLICPGRVRTNISLHALDKDGKAYGKMSPGQQGGISPASAARQIIKAVQ